MNNFLSFVVFSVAFLAVSNYASGQRCGPNERMGECGRICEEKCGEDGMEECSRTTCAGSGCQCIPGYKRNAVTDLCVLPSQCPAPITCGPNEVVRNCGRPCEGTCTNPSIPIHCRNLTCESAGCVCDHARGYVRMGGDVCGRNQDNRQCAAQLRCPPNSVPTLCGRECGRTCAQLVPTRCPRDRRNCVIDCMCSHGLVLDERTGKCVMPRDCSH